MSNGTISMRKLKSILQLKYQAKLSHRQIARSLLISPSVVSNYANRAAQLGIACWPLPGSWDDTRLEQAFLNTQVKSKPTSAVPNWGQVHQQLKAKGVTLERLWQEYAEGHPDNHFSYNHFCYLYRQFKPTLRPSMRQVHKAGEKLFVDYAGQSVPLIEPKTNAQIFVATLGASNYTYAEATLSQALEDWCMSHKRAFEFFGGVTELVVPDNLKSAVNKACRFDPDLNPTYHQLACYYGVAILPTRIRKPKDKAKVEGAVLLVERWILACLRHEAFYTLAQLNQRIAELLYRLNDKPFQKLPGSRASQFELLDKPALKPLPKQPYLFTQVKRVRVGLDYHIELEGCYYSVPYVLVKKMLEAHVSERTVRLLFQGKCVAQHVRQMTLGCQSTLKIHMPKHHQAYLDYDIDIFKQRAQDIGPDVFTWVKQKLASKAHPQQAYRASASLLALVKTYGDKRLNAACQRGLSTGANELKNIKAILKNRLDQIDCQQVSEPLSELSPHANLRQPHEFH